MKKDERNVVSEEKEKYINRKIEELKKQGISSEEASNKARQSYRSYIGKNVQANIMNYLKEQFKGTCIKITSDEELKSTKITEELSKIKRAIALDFGQYLFLPDADIVVYKSCESEPVVLAIISVKNSFRERGYETAYWKKKLAESKITSHVKVFLATPDKDDEIAFIERKKGPRKSRIILEYELDGIYFLDKEKFDGSAKVKEFSKIVDDILNLSNKYK